MANHKLNESAAVVSDALSNLLASQSWFARRKNSLVALAAGILQVVNLVALLGNHIPAELNVLIAVAVFFAETVTQASMRGAFTPSMHERLVDEVTDVEDAYSGLPVYTGPLSSS